MPLIISEAPAAIDSSIGIESLTRVARLTRFSIPDLFMVCLLTVPV
jgi:hypothetical protein